ncbi:Mu-like prophage protein gp36 [Maribacter dokdonensis]|uniref:phage protein Gp36 family protein n=1 Tax=Maribacter dokdonensis TaxID=320912 RepID=UPI001B14031B|nr:phage protein Gp36 family protein [Maribacter dokdonensis]CAG2532938.1 Mu-like prophage protein gp36 [Maribacter dokdonensis]
MAFLKTEDYQVQVRQWVTNILTDGGTTLMERAEMAAQEEMESYLANKFDVATIFDPAQPEADRNALVVMYMVDIAVYHLHANITPNDVPEVRQVRYDNAIAWLRKVNKGELSPNLPLPPVEEGEEDEGSVEFQGGSNESVTHRY